MIRNIAFGLGLFSIACTLIPIINHEVWWIRIFDFPRLQIITMGIISVILFLVSFNKKVLYHNLFVILLMASTGYQFYNIFPYTFLSPKQVLDSRISNQKGQQISILVSNVYMENRNSAKLLRIIEQNNPDIVLTLETDSWWKQQLDTLGAEYKHQVIFPLDNTYGLLLYSKLKLINPEVKFLIEDSIPSVHSIVELRSGDPVMFYGIHPKPPSPQESTTSIKRDAELIVVGKMAKDSGLPAIVAGDLNDVAWSQTSKLFQKISGLLDPRIGRGMYSTFHADYIIFRWPLDHIFHSNEFKVISIKRLSNIGSDHFPILLNLNYTPEEKNQQKAPKADTEDKKEAKEKVEQAL